LTDAGLGKLRVASSAAGSPGSPPRIRLAMAGRRFGVALRIAPAARRQHRDGATRRLRHRRRARLVRRREAEAAALCKELGLEAHLIGTTERNRKVLLEQRGHLVAMPEGLMLGVPTRIAPMLTTSMFTWRRSSGWGSSR